MKTFLAMYLGTADSAARTAWDDLDPQTCRQREQAGMEAWGQWMSDRQASIVDAGGPLGATKRVSVGGVEDAKNAMTGYVVLRAESHEAAARQFENHPHFAIFPGEAVEIMEVLAIPEP